MSEWTAKTPTERGWYWIRDKAGNVSLHFVAQRPGHAYLCVEDYFPKSGFSLKREFTPVSRMPFMFAGPLEPPK